MRNLIGFLIKIGPLLLFLLLETVAVVFMVNRSKYHSYAVLSTSNVVSGGVLDASNSVSSYFSLRSVNADLAKENSDLKNEIEVLKEIIAEYDNYVNSLDSKSVLQDNPFAVSCMDSLALMKHIPAKVIGNSVNKLDNYITLDKGRRDGVACDMGVICSGGVVGIVATVSDHFSVVLPILNSLSRTSCRLDSTKAIGSLVWKGLNPSYAYLEEVPRHVVVSEGELVYTSGFSHTFPEGVPVGTIEEFELKESDSFYKIKVKLSTQFNKLSYVDVVSYNRSEELNELIQDKK